MERTFEEICFNGTEESHATGLSKWPRIVWAKIAGLLFMNSFTFMNEVKNDNLPEQRFVLSLSFLQTMILVNRVSWYNNGNLLSRSSSEARFDSAVLLLTPVFSLRHRGVSTLLITHTLETPVMSWRGQYSSTVPLSLFIHTCSKEENYFTITNSCFTLIKERIGNALATPALIKSFLIASQGWEPLFAVHFPSIVISRFFFSSFCHEKGEKLGYRTWDLCIYILMIWRRTKRDLFLFTCMSCGMQVCISDLRRTNKPSHINKIYYFNVHNGISSRVPDTLEVEQWKFDLGLDIYYYINELTLRGIH